MMLGDAGMGGLQRRAFGLSATEGDQVTANMCEGAGRRWSGGRVEVGVLPCHRPYHLTLLLVPHAFRLGLCLTPTFPLTPRPVAPRFPNPPPRAQLLQGARGGGGGQGGAGGVPRPLCVRQEEQVLRPIQVRSRPCRCESWCVIGMPHRAGLVAVRPPRPRPRSVLRPRIVETHAPPTPHPHPPTGVPTLGVWDHRCAPAHCRSTETAPKWWMVDVQLARRTARPVTLAELRQEGARGAPIQSMVLINK